MALQRVYRSWLLQGVQQLTGCRSLFTTASSHGNRPYFRPDQPDTYEKWDALWHKRPERVSTAIPWERVPLSADQRFELRSAALQAGLPPNLWQPVLLAVRRGQAPYEPAKLSQHLAALYDLERRLPGFSVNALLRRARRGDGASVLNATPAALSRQVKFVAKLAPRVEAGPLLAGAPEWVVRAPKELAARLAAAPQLWQQELGVAAPPRALLSAAGLRRLGGQTASKNARHMRQLVAEHGREAAAQLYGRCPQLLGYKARHLQGNGRALQRVLGVDAARLSQLAAAQPRLLTRDGGRMALRLRSLGRLVLAAPATHSGGTGGGGEAEQAGVHQRQGEQLTDGSAAVNSSEGVGGSGEAAPSPAADASLAAGAALLLGCPSLGIKSTATLRGKAKLLGKALSLDAAQLASLLSGAPNLLTRSTQALGETAKALAALPPGSPLAMDGTKVRQAVLAAPRLLGYSAAAVGSRLQLLEALRGVSDSWDAKVRDAAADAAGLAEVLAARREQLLRLHWVVGTQAQAAPAQATLLELMRLGDQDWRGYFPAYSGEAGLVAARGLTGGSDAW